MQNTWPQTSVSPISKNWLGVLCPDSDALQPQQGGEPYPQIGLLTPLNAVEARTNMLVPNEAEPLETMNKLSDFCTTCKHSLTPIYTLPPEVLHLIFALAFESASESIETTHRISQVSRLWRDVAIRQSELWRCIPPSCDQFIDLWISRSNSLPLSLVFGSVHPSRFYHLVNRRPDILPRVRRIIIRWHSHFESPGFVNVQFPAVECVTLIGFSNGFVSEHGPPDPYFEELLPRMPRLRRLSLDGMGAIRSASIASTLTELHIGCSCMTPSAWNFLTEVKHLHTLVVSRVTTSTYPASIVSGWELPSLRILQLEACDPETIGLFSRQIIFPNLHDLRVFSHSQCDLSRRDVEIPFLYPATIRQLLNCSRKVKKLSLNVSLRILDGLIAGSLVDSFPCTFLTSTADLDEIQVTLTDPTLSDTFPISSADTEMALTCILSYIRFRGFRLPFERSGNTVVSRAGKLGQKLPAVSLTGPSWIAEGLSTTWA